MDDCEFCGIVSGERDARIVYETDETVAFLDNHPATRGHTLVVPKAHCETLFTGESSASLPVFRTVDTVVTALNGTLDPAGVSLCYTSGHLVGNVSHAHVHVLPRYEDDDVHIALARDSFDEDDAARVASRIREHL